MSTGELRLERRDDAPLVCCVCRDALGETEGGCPRCDARWHPECSEELLRCPTIGCAQPVARASDDLGLRRSFGEMVLRWWPLYLLTTFTLPGGLLLVLVLNGAIRLRRLVRHPEDAFVVLGIVAASGLCAVALVRGLRRIHRRWRIQRVGSYMLARVAGWAGPPQAPLNSLVFTYRPDPSGPELQGQTGLYPRGELQPYPPGSRIRVWVDPRPPHEAWWEHDDD